MSNEAYYTIRKSTFRLIAALVSVAVFLIGTFYTTFFLTPKEVHTVRTYFNDEREIQKREIALAVWQNGIEGRLENIEKLMAEKAQVEKDILALLRKIDKRQD